MTRRFTVKPLRPEKIVQNAVIAHLNFHNWMVQINKENPQDNSAIGRPDLEAYRNGFVLFVENKAPEGVVSPITGRKSRGGKLRKGQPEYHQKLRDAGMTVWVVDDSEKFLEHLEGLEYRLWGIKSRRIS